VKRTYRQNFSFRNFFTYTNFEKEIKSIKRKKKEL